MSAQTLTGRSDRHFDRTTALALLVYALLALGAFGFVGPFADHQLPKGGVGDPAQMVWFLAWTPFALAHGHNILQTNFIDYPSGVNLANNTSVPLLGLLGAPITAIAGPIATFNFLLRLALFASAGSMCLVARTFTRGLLGPFAAGLAYGFGPYLASQAQGNAHLNLLFAPFPPLILWCVYELVVARRHRPGRVGLLLGVTCAAQLLVAPEVLSDCVVLALVGLLGLAISQRSAVRARLRTLIPGALTALASFVLIGALPIWWMLDGPAHLRGTVLSGSHLQAFRADLLAPVLPTTRLLFAPQRAVALAHFATKDSSELGGYLGLPLLIALAIVVIVYRRQPAVRVFAGLSVLAFVFSLGARLTVNGHSTWFPLPEAVFTHLPLLDDTVPGRFALEVALFASLLFAIGIDRTVQLIAARSRPRRAVISIAMTAGVALCLVGLAPAVPFAESKLPWSDTLVSSLERAVPSGTTILTYPYPSPPFIEAMVWQAQSSMHVRILGGYATVNGPHSAQYWPTLLRPAGLQETLGHLHGPGSHFPAPPDSRTARAAICPVLNRNQVGAVVLWRAAPDSAGAAAYLSSVLGPPRSAPGDLELWSRSMFAARCPNSD